MQSLIKTKTVVLPLALFGVAFWWYVNLWRDAPIIMSDSWGYMRSAFDLADGRVDQLQNRTPGYPLVLLLTGSQETPNRRLLFLSLILHFSSIWVVAGVLADLGISQRLLWVFYVVLLLPTFVEPAAYVLAENLTEFMLVVSFAGIVFWLSQRRGLWLLMAVTALSYTALTRPTYQLLSVVLAGFVAIAPKVFRWPRRIPVGATLALATVPVLVLLGYALSNHQKFGFFGVSPMAGVHLSTRTSGVVERLPDEYATVREILIKARDADLVQRGGEHNGYEYLQNPGVLAEVSKATGLEGALLARYLININMLLIQRAPQQYLAEVAQAFSMFWLPASTNLANMSSRNIQLLWSVLHFGVMSVSGATLIVLLGTAVYLANTKQSFRNGDVHGAFEVRLIRRQGAIYALAALIVLYGALITSLFESGNPRYRVPTDILIVSMALIGVTLLRRLTRITAVSFSTPRVSFRTTD